MSHRDAFDLAQGSHQAVEQVRKQTRKVGQKKKTNSISNKEINPTGKLNAITCKGCVFCQVQAIVRNTMA